jgi:CPA2 family monovalent cation:H+ antiporter-2
MVVGSRVLPRILSQVAHLGSRELFVVAVAVVAIGTATLAAQLGVSVALGAFVAGMALAESDLAASVLGEVVPLRELFATIFFVSVGILLEPAEILAGWPTVMLTTIAGGQRPGTALRAAGLVAQAGEFSFVLAAVGLQTGALGGDTFSQAMGAVVATVVLAAPVADLASRLGQRLEQRFPPAPVRPGDEPAAGMRRHVVVLGYGHVGKTVARLLERRGFPWVAIDADYAMVRSAAAAGSPLVYGDAGTPSVLDAVRIAEASTLVVALPDPLATRQAVEYGLRHNPRLHVIARAHSAGDEAELRRLGAARIVTAERELGNELVRHALRRYGVSDREIDAMVRRE